MHELSLCRSITAIVDRARSGRPVVAVHLQVGQLRQVVPATLEYCWSVLTETTPLAGSVLDIDHVPVRLECRACGEHSTVEHDLVLACAACSGTDVRLVTGDEFLVASVDLGPAPVLSGEH